jgi:tetratricopeptide (TPR) repeat protein
MPNETSEMTGLTDGTLITEAVARLDVLIRNTTSNILSFVVFRYIAEQVAFLAALREKLPLPITECVLSPEKCDPFEFLAAIPPEPRVCVLFSEIENALSARTEDDKPKLAGFVNLQRERLLEIPHAVIFLVREYGFREIATHAPDFFHWSSGTYEIAGELPDPSSLMMRNILGKAQEIRNKQEAEQKISLYRELLEEYEKAEPLDELFIAELYTKLGDVLDWLGRYEESELLYKRTLKILEQRLGEEHVSTAAALNNLGLAIEKQDRFLEAELLYRRALLVREQLLGLEHPNTATVLNNLANVYEKQGRIDEAETLYRRALEVLERLLGAEHPDIAALLSNLAGLYRDKGQFAEAESLYKRALEIQERSLGVENQGAVRLFNNLARFYYEQGRLTEAEQLLDRAMLVGSQTLGSDHPEMKNILTGLLIVREKIAGLSSVAQKSSS